MVDVFVVCVGGGGGGGGILWLKKKLMEYIHSMESSRSGQRISTDKQFDYFICERLTEVKY